MSLEPLEIVQGMIRTGIITRESIAPITSKLNTWQRDTIVLFDKKKWTGKLTYGQMFNIGKFARDSEFGDQYIWLCDMEQLGLIRTFPGVSVGHNRYQLTPSGIAVGLILEQAITPDKAKERGSGIEYSGMTTAQILATIPEPSEDRVLPPPHILALLDVFIVQQERPGDDELQDAINEAYESEANFTNNKVIIAGKEYSID